MTKKYILSIAIVLGFLGGAEASNNEDLKSERKEIKGVIFYGYGEATPEKKKDQKKNNTSFPKNDHPENVHEYMSFGGNFSLSWGEKKDIVGNTPPEKTKNSFAKSLNIPINRELRKSPQSIHEFGLGSSSKIVEKKKLSVEESKKTKNTSIPQSPTILFKNSVERVAITNSFTVGSPPKGRRVQESSIEKNKSKLINETVSETQKNPKTRKKEKKLVKKKSPERDNSFIFQFDIEDENEDEKQNTVTVLGILPEIIDSDSESFEDKKQKKLQNLSSDDEN